MNRTLTFEQLKKLVVDDKLVTEEDSEERNPSLMMCDRCGRMFDDVDVKIADHKVLCPRCAEKVERSETEVNESRKVDTRQTRAFTNALINDAEQGILSWEEIAKSALYWMSEDDVQNMAESELDYEEAEEDSDEVFTEAHGDKNNRGWRKNKGGVKKESQSTQMGRS